MPPRDPDTEGTALLGVVAGREGRSSWLGGTRKLFGLFLVVISALAVVAVLHFKPTRTRKGFPESFLWGAATSSYQIEGAFA